MLKQSNFDRNVFIITPFRSDARYVSAIETMKRELEKQNFKGWTADELDLGEDLWVSVRCFMHACRYAIALITADEKQHGEKVQIRADVYNPNVIAEAGYMLGQGKKVLLLKDNRVRLPTDWLGKLFRPINFANPAPEITDAIGRWIQHHKLEMTG